MTRPPHGEFGLIAALAEQFGAPPVEVRLGIGDDCAALAWPDGHCLLWTMDTLVEEVHFTFAYLTPRQLGAKSLAVNLSDIAAMGGEPRYALLSLGWPKDRPLSEALEFGRGLAEAARHYGVKVIGGDTVASPPGVVITVTVLGKVPEGEMLRRAGARPHDLIFVTGPLGEAAAGLLILQRGLALEQEVAAPLIQAHVNPRPQLAAGRLLAGSRLATALIDLSDGVASDLWHICRASGVGADLEARRLPVPPGVAAVARQLHLAPLDLALKGGEDYQLLFTSPPDREASLYQAFSQAGLGAPVRLGEIVAGAEVRLISADGDKIISGTGYNHFA
jgi:thiamine-monophosphate kinase